MIVLAAASLCAAPPLSPGRKFTTIERLETAHLAAVHQARLDFAAARKQVAPAVPYTDYRAVMHVHAQDAPHTKGTRFEALEGAKAARVSIVMWTDHHGPKPDTWTGLIDGILFIPGSEDDHLLRFPKPGAELRFLSHLEETPDANGEGFAGMEIYNRHTDAKDEEEFDKYFQAAMQNPAEWSKLAENDAKYPDEVFGAQQDYWPSIMAIWDRELRTHLFTGIAANDSHKNQTYNGVTFDPYEVSFRDVSTHILSRELTDPAIRDSLRAGRVYVAHDWLCDPAGFNFIARHGAEVFTMGDRVPLGTRLEAHLPIAAGLKLIRNGEVVSQSTGDSIAFTPKDPGAYRLEAWLTVDGEQRPWIYANPIWIEPQSKGDGP